jgi:hypothetical protein
MFGIGVVLGVLLDLDLVTQAILLMLLLYCPSSFVGAYYDLATQAKKIRR